MSRRPLLVRADASVGICIGHVMRCHALAQAWQDRGGEVSFASVDLLRRLKKRLDRDAIEEVPVTTEPGSAPDARQLVREARQRNVQAVVIDGYRFGADYQKAVHGTVPRLLVIDDHGQATRYHADIVLDQNLGAQADDYARRPDGRGLLLGPRYALLRREFRTLRQVGQDGCVGTTKILVTLGGSDPRGLTADVVSAVREATITGAEIRVVVGPVSSEVAIRDSDEIRLLRDPDTMAELMAWADVAVSAAGTTAWELLCVGTPTVLVPVSPNQEPIARRLQDAAPAVTVAPDGSEGWLDRLANAVSGLIEDVDARRMLATAGRALVDGRGAKRVATELGGIG